MGLMCEEKLIWGPRADVKYPPEIPSTLSMKCALVFLFMVELELSLFGVFRFSPWHVHTLNSKVASAFTYYYISNEC